MYLKYRLQVWRLNNRASMIIKEADDETLNTVKLYF